MNFGQKKLATMCRQHRQALASQSGGAFAYNFILSYLNLFYLNSFFFLGVVQAILVSIYPPSILAAQLRHVSTDLAIFSAQSQLKALPFVFFHKRIKVLFVGESCRPLRSMFFAMQATFS